jgi:hypothetical protein
MRTVCALYYFLQYSLRKNIAELSSIAGVAVDTACLWVHHGFVLVVFQKHCLMHRPGC